ncbi:beta-lactamase-like protein [Limtongia smithiae]|uniref:beta-lactamase-like protein n=1 Tax=Limtongia smithiae TaxID=1125753 RepID=UPI0034CDEE1C
MSTFKGIPREFPEIRIDYFRDQPGTVPPQACFLSHVHTDHLHGLMSSYSGPSIYCSFATKRLLLRLESRRTRLERLNNDLDQNSLAGRRMFRHLGPECGRNVLRELPFDTRTVIDLDPVNQIAVTLIEANHCPGSTMFLIEGRGKVILYTGDVHAEDWWTRELQRNPILFPYTHGFARIDTIYLDTSCCSSPAMCIEAASNERGTGYMIKRILDYPPDTIFHFNSWTLGYEELFIAICRAFNTQIHTDAYRYQMYKAISHQAIYKYGPALAGLSQDSDDGCITLNATSTRFHCCEQEHPCAGRKGASQPIIQISPIVINTQSAAFSADQVACQQVLATRMRRQAAERDQIIVPYSRHSSYLELCALVELFRPADVYPNVVTSNFAVNSLSMRELFGRFCSQDRYFHFDETEHKEMRSAHAKQRFNEFAQHVGNALSDATKISNDMILGKRKQDEELELEDSDRMPKMQNLGTEHDMLKLSSDVDKFENADMTIPERFRNDGEPDVVMVKLSLEDMEDNFDVTIIGRAEWKASQVSLEQKWSPRLNTSRIANNSGNIESQSRDFDIEIMEGALQAKEEQELSPAVCKTEVFDKTTVKHVKQRRVKEELKPNHTPDRKGSPDMDKVKRAEQAAWGMNGESWFDVALFSTLLVLSDEVVL